MLPARKITASPAAFLKLAAAPIAPCEIDESPPPEPPRTPAGELIIGRKACISRLRKRARRSGLRLGNSQKRLPGPFQLYDAETGDLLDSSLTLEDLAARFNVLKPGEVLGQ